MCGSGRIISCVWAVFMASVGGFMPAAAKPDYVVQNIELLPANPVAGQKIRFQAWMRNVGQARANSCKHSIRVGGETIPFHNTIPGSLDPGQATMMMREATLDKPGRYRVTFVVDVDNVVAESNEANNEGFLAFVVQGPDLTFRNLKVTPAHPKVNEEFLVTAELTNIGPIACNTTVSGIYIGGASSPILQQSTSVTPNHHILVSQHHTFTQAGNFTIRFIADQDKRIDESDETNNEAKLSFTVQ